MSSPGRRRRRRRIGALAVATITVASFVGAPLAPVSVRDAGAAPSTTAAAFRPLEPCRLFDSRTDGVRLGDHDTVIVATFGGCGIPEGTRALALSVTVTEARASGFATVWPGDMGRPATSTVNYAAGETRANGAIIAIGTDGTLAVSSSASAHVVIDVNGAFVATSGATAGRFVATSPERLLDTRAADGRLPAGGTVTIPLPAGVPADATAIAVTIATSDSVGAGFFTVYPTGTERPLSSSLNTDGRGQVRATGQLVPVNGDGFTVFSQAGEHLIVDMTGWFTGQSAPWSDDGLFVPAPPTRLIDTRDDTSLFPGGTVQLDSSAVTGGPVAAVAGNWTLTRTWRGGFLTVHPAGTDRPLVATANADRRNQNVSQFGITATSWSGLAAYSSNGTQLVVDITGWFTGSPLPTSTDAMAPNTPVADTSKRVVLIGDSTLAGVRWYTKSQQALGGSNFVLDAESCRRLVGSSCRGREGRRPPNTIEAIGDHDPFDVLVVMTGYNDWHTTFATAFDQTVAAARAKGAYQILWLTYRERSTYSNPTGGMSQAEGFAIQNRIIRDKIASGAFPDVMQLDWNAYTANRTDWFTSDGVHFTIQGAYGAADYISRAVASLHDEPCPAPWTPGGAVEMPCSFPDGRGDTVDPLALYAGNPNDVHCYQVGADRHVECRVDPKLAH